MGTPEGPPDRDEKEGPPDTPPTLRLIPGSIRHCGRRFPHSVRQTQPRRWRPHRSRTRAEHRDCVARRSRLTSPR
jgi:hypothetical protein